MAAYSLPDLPYDYGSLEPHISGKIMELHHSKHHAAYVKGVNSALDHLEEARANNSFATVNQFEKDMAFHLGGHINHSIFWKNLSPDGGDKPTGDLAAAIDENFGSFDAFRGQFDASALGLQGSGWAILAWESLAKKLVVVQLYDQQSNIPASLIPILQLDMWEHAFYLDYLNVKGDYVKAFWNIANWADAQERFTAASASQNGVLLP